VTADRGYGEARVEADLRDIGVKPLPYPVKDNPALPDRSPNAVAASAISSNGAPAAKDASATSNTATDGPAQL
jgi:hypothetical protein